MEVWNQSIGWTDGDGMPFGFTASVDDTGSVLISGHSKKMINDSVESKTLELFLTFSQLKSLSDLAMSARLVGSERQEMYREKIFRQS